METASQSIPTNEYLLALADLMRQGRTVSLAVTGNSMSPFLVHGRDQLCLQRPEGRPKRGDMVLFRRKNGAFIMHRICHLDPEGNCYLVGDGQQAIEGPVSPEQVVGIVNKVCRKGHWLGPEDFWWRFFAGPWLWLRPLRPLLRRGYGWISRIWKRGGTPHDEAGA